MSGGFPIPALRSAGSETALKRVTIVASRPDDTLVYLQADYSSTTESSARAEPSTSTASAAEAVGPLTALSARVSLEASRGNPYTSSRGIELYSSTQRMLAETETPMTHIDVHA
jgi:hypothetical protein